MERIKMNPESNVNTELVKYLAQIKTLCGLKGRDAKITMVVRTIPLSQGKVESASRADIDCMILSDDNPFEAMDHMVEALQESPAHGVVVKSSRQGDNIVIELGEEVPVDFRNPSSSTLVN
jgi:hypothetical protein